MFVSNRLPGPYKFALCSMVVYFYRCPAWVYSNMSAGLFRDSPNVVLSIDSVYQTDNIALFFLLSLVVLGFPMGLIFLYFPNQMIVPAILETIGVTFLFCSIGLLTKKDLTNWGGFLSLALASLAMDSVLNLQFFHLSWFAYSISFGTTVLFLAYLIYDANQAMQNYDEAKRLGGIYFIAILLASSLEILLDMIYLFWNNLVPGDDNDADSGFDSFW